jgi:RNA 2',3'-cyclic 3'-phosphodiesterase
MRLFTGLSLPFEVRRNIELLYQHVCPLADLRWSPPENLHITTHFIGDWPDARLDELKSALRAFPKPAAFALDIAGLGWYPNPHHPRVFFAGVRAEPSLLALATTTRDAMAALGLAPEDRDYSPHLTLARVPAHSDLLPLKRAIAGLPSVDFGRVEVRKFNLYVSTPGPQASVYSVLEEYPL